MANVRFAYDNLIDRTTTTLTASSESSTLPVGNLKNHLISKTWRTGNTLTTEYVEIDLGSAQSVTCAIIGGHTLTSSDSGIKIEANTSNSWGTPAFSQSFTWDSGPMPLFFSSQTYQYWRLVFTKSSASETRDIGKIFLGQYFEPTKNIARESLSINRRDLSRSGRAIGGQTYADVRSQYRRINMSFQNVSQSQFDLFDSFAATVGTHTPFWVSIDHDTRPNDWLFYVKFSRLFQTETVALAGAIGWNSSMTLDEQL